VFKGPVGWTEKMTKTGPNTTECNRTISCGCTGSVTFGCQLQGLTENQKTDENRFTPVATGLLYTYITNIF
jgi:hypothetical protein